MIDYYPLLWLVGGILLLIGITVFFFSFWEDKPGRIDTIFGMGIGGNLIFIGTLIGGIVIGVLSHG